MTSGDVPVADSVWTGMSCVMDRLSAGMEVMRRTDVPVSLFCPVFLLTLEYLINVATRLFTPLPHEVSACLSYYDSYNSLMTTCVTGVARKICHERDITLVGYEKWVIWVIKIILLFLLCVFGIHLQCVFNLFHRQEPKFNH